MNRLAWLIGIVLTLNVFASAQKQKVQEDSMDRPARESKTTQSSAKNSRQSGTDKHGQLSLASGTNIEAQLQSALDVKKSNVGDEVVFKTTRSIKQNGETVIAKGSNIIGHITEVQQRAKGNTQSRLGLVFDRVEGRNLTAPITASIVSITNAQANNSAGDVFDSDISGSSSTSARASGRDSGSGGAGGGLLGGVGNTVGSVTNSVGGVTGSAGGVLNTATQTVGGVAGTATQTLGGTTQGLVRTVNGIQISQTLSGSAHGSTTLSSQNKNLRLEKGTTFQLQLANAAATGN